MDFILDREELLELINLEYIKTSCSSCIGRGTEFVCENGDVHPSRKGFEGTWFYDCMEQSCEKCEGLGVKILLNNGRHLP
ncbi:hypothetical protein VP424E501_P0198 [Vibrio phage 424E50-1]|nr:hypothetical protein VP424E501_P0198 [Vibrio phage 424E50-1]